MKSGFKNYVIIWSILLIVFNFIVFVIPSEVAGMNKFAGGFWSGYVFISLAFIGQLICGYFAFKNSNTPKQLFLNLPLITISYSALIISIIIGSLCIALPNVPNWLGAVLCVLFLGLNATLILKAQAASQIVTNVDNAVKKNTQLFKMLSCESHNLIMKSSNVEIKKYCVRVYELIRYSDPMSNDKLADIEENIEKEFLTFTNAVMDNNTESVKVLADKLFDLIYTRNNKCKMLK